MSPPNEERRPRQESGATSKRPGEESSLILVERTDRFGYGGPRHDPTANAAIARVDRERSR